MMFSRLFVWYAERPKKMVQNFSSWEEKVRSANDHSLCWEAPALAFYSCKKSGRKSFVLSTLRSPLIPVYQDMLAHYQTYPRQTGFLAALNIPALGNKPQATSPCPLCSHMFYQGPKRLCSPYGQSRARITSCTNARGSPRPLQRYHRDRNLLLCRYQ